ncbi:MAG: phosphoribosylformylglycinamidine synthase subunit PurS [Bacilli bacterium]
MFKVKVYVTLRESVLDPQGQAVNDALHTLGYSEVSDVRIGKYIELTVNEMNDTTEARVREMCEKLLVNVVIEDFRYDVEEVR